MTYKISLYPGFGVELVTHTVTDVNCEQDALEKLCSTLSTLFFRPIDDLEEDEIDFCEQNPDMYMYVDSTEYGGKCGYLNILNMKIECINN